MGWKKFYEVEAGLYIKRVGEDDWEFVEGKEAIIEDEEQMDDFEERTIVEFAEKYGLESEPWGDFDAGYPFSDFNRGFYRTFYYEMPDELVEETGIEEWKVEFVYEVKWVKEEEEEEEERA